MEQLDPSMVQTRRPSQRQPSEASRQGPGGLLDELVEEGQGEPLAGRTVGGVGEPPLSELDDVLAGGVLQEHLKKEQVDGLDGAEHPVSASDTRHLCKQTKSTLERSRRQRPGAGVRG